MHLGKALGILLVLLGAIIIISTISVSAYEEISSVPYSGILSDKPMYTVDSGNIVQIYYQKFKTDNLTLATNYIRLYLPSNITTNNLFFWTTFHGFRIGIAKSYETPGLANPSLKYTPLQWYNLMASWIGGFRCQGTFNYNLRGGWRDISITTGNVYLEPNTVYYIAWFTWDNGFDTGYGPYSSYMPRGTTPGAFTVWSQHRGNVTSSVWTDPYSSYNLSYYLYGTKLELTTGVSGVDNNSAALTTTIVNLGNRNWTRGYWLGNTTTDFGSFETNTTIATNSSTNAYGVTLSSLMPGKYYHLRSWVSKNASYPFVHGEEVHFLTNPQPPTNLYIPARSNSGLQNFSWTNGTSNESGLRTVVFNRSSGPVTDPYTALPSEICYNGTGVNHSSFMLGSTETYLTVFSYLEKTEDGENIGKFSLTGVSELSSPGNLIYHVYIMNEKTPFGLATLGAGHPSSIEFSTKDGLVTYVGLTTTNTMTIYANASDLVTFRWNYSVSGPSIERNHLIPDSNLSSDRNIYIYVPNVVVGTAKGNSKPVTILLKDKTGGKYTVENYAQLFILANGSKESNGRDIHSDFAQADLGVRTYLVIGDQYALFGKSDAMSLTRLGSLIIFDESTYTIDVTTTDVQNISWASVVSITTGRSGTSIWARLLNEDAGIWNVTVRLYNSTGSLKKTEVYQKSGMGFTPSIWPPWNFNFTYDTGSTNKTLYYANFYMKYTKGSVNWISSAWIYWSPDSSGTVNTEYLDSILTQILGPSPIYLPAEDGNPEVVIPYSTLVLTAIVVLFFFIFRENAGFAVIVMGGILTITRIIGLASETILPSVSIGVIFLIGVLIYLITRDRPTEGPTNLEKVVSYRNMEPGTISVRRKK